jgi:hypothetical protein
MDFAPMFANTLGGRNVTAMANDLYSDVDFNQLNWLEKQWGASWSEPTRFLRLPPNDAFHQRPQLTSFCVSPSLYSRMVHLHR